MARHETPSRIEPAAGGDRRGFLTRFAAAAVGAIVALVPAAAGLAVFLDPLRRKNRLEGFLRVTSLSALPADGMPRQFPVMASRSDAWSGFPQDSLGAVYLVRDALDQVTCFNAVCPHAGCFVDFIFRAREFRCPCHDSAFELSGARVGADCPSPRDLDSLEVDKARLTQGEVWVRFQNFRAGKAEKIVDS